uniref:Carboxypeptidase M n=1 Tax=Lygus hesperus TaxID=30085 RepID=A0A0K8TBC4_LYGHE
MKDVCGALLAVTLWVSVASFRHHYRNNSELNTLLNDMETSHSHLARVYSIGKSVKETDLKVIQLSGPNVSIGTPHVKLVGNIHGNEPLGRELLLRLADYLISGYESGDDEAMAILDKMYVHILPTMNPDGFAEALEGECVNGPGRRNANEKDLNRDFPSHKYPSDTMDPVQPETAAIMEWMYKYPFVMSAAIHGGALVANYPYDVAKTKEVHDLQQMLQGPGGYERLMEMLKTSPSNFPGSRAPEDHKTEDNDMFRAMAFNYAEEHGHMADSKECPDSNDQHKFDRGTTNGAAWYSFTGSMGDYNYDYHGCLELTLELSCCKYPGDHELEKHWNDNKKALLSFLKYSQQGVKGVIYNGTDEPVSKAAVSIYGRKQVHYSTENGEYWILLLPGKYWLEVEKFEKKIFRKITVPDSPFDNPLILNLDLATAAAEDYPQPSDFDPEQDNTGDFLMVGVDRKDAQEYEEIHEAMVNERKNMNEDERYDDETLPYPGDSRAADTYRLNSFICIICSIFSLLFCK